VEGLLSAAVQGFLNNPTSSLTTKLQRIRQTLVDGLKEEEQISQAMEHTGRLTIDEIEQSISQKEKEIRSKLANAPVGYPGLQRELGIATSWWISRSSSYD